MRCSYKVIAQHNNNWSLMGLTLCQLHCRVSYAQRNTYTGPVSVMLSARPKGYDQGTKLRAMHAFFSLQWQTYGSGTIVGKSLLDFTNSFNWSFNNMNTGFLWWFLFILFPGITCQYWCTGRHVLLTTKPTQLKPGLYFWQRNTASCSKALTLKVQVTWTLASLYAVMFAWH